jgi:signal transduction histidine kinase
VAGTAVLLLAVWGAFRLRVGQVRSRFALVLSERNRIARDMHDSLEQGLAAVALQLELCAKMNDNGATGPVLQQRLDLTRDVLEHARAEAKRSIADLRSRDLESGGLVTALSMVAGQFSTGTDLKIDVSVSGRTRPLAGVIENDLLRICQEAVANAVRHGQALAVTIDLTFASDRVRLVVIDDGRGFDVERAVSARDGHFGLMGMRERAKKLGGHLHLQSTPGRGTEVQVEIPVSG